MVKSVGFGYRVWVGIVALSLRQLWLWAKLVTCSAFWILICKMDTVKVPPLWVSVWTGKINRSKTSSEVLGTCRSSINVSYYLKTSVLKSWFSSIGCHYLLALQSLAVRIHHSIYEKSDFSPLWQRGRSVSEVESSSPYMLWGPENALYRTIPTSPAAKTDILHTWVSFAWVTWQMPSPHPALHQPSIVLCLLRLWGGRFGSGLS